MISDAGNSAFPSQK